MGRRWLSWAVQFQIAFMTQGVEVFLCREQFCMESNTGFGQRDTIVITGHQTFAFQVKQNSVHLSEFNSFWAVRDVVNIHRRSAESNNVHDYCGFESGNFGHGVSPMFDWVSRFDVSIISKNTFTGKHYIIKKHIFYLMNGVIAFSYSLLDLYKS